MYLYQVDYLDLKKKLRAAYEDWKSGKLLAKGKRTREHMLEALSSEKIHNSIEKIIEEIK